MANGIGIYIYLHVAYTRSHSQLHAPPATRTGSQRPNCNC